MLDTNPIAPRLNLFGLLTDTIGKRSLKPKISAIPENSGQDQRRIGRDCTAIGTQPIDGFSTDSHRFLQLSYSQHHRLGEFPCNHLADTNGLTLCDIHGQPVRT